MNGVFLFALIIYLLVFIGIAVVDIKKISGFTDYAVAGRSQGTFAVTMTLLATVIGASTTIGICDTVAAIGFPGIWWLAFGAIGLILQAFLLSGRVRELKADTLPDLAGITVGKGAEALLAAIFVISWIGVIAGQFVAMDGLITFATGRSSKLLFFAVSAIVVIYTLIGGQMSVVKTDKVQLFIIVIGIFAACIYLYASKGVGGDLGGQVELLNESYKPVNLFTQFFVIGGVYFLGPDIMSRTFVSKDPKTAKRSALSAGLALLAFSLLITLVGMWVRISVSPEELGESKALMYVAGILPRGLSVLLIFGLLSAILSSTDTCLINASTILVKDILKKESTGLIRITVAVFGLLAVLLAGSGRGDIMALLTGAYSIYTPGVIFPLLVAILAYRRRELSKGLWLFAVAAGGSFGICGTYFTKAMTSLGVSAKLISYFPLIGMGVSLLFALLSVKWRKKVQEGK